MYVIKRSIDVSAAEEGRLLQTWWMAGQKLPTGLSQSVKAHQLSHLRG